MKIKVKKRITVEDEVEVTFPIYVRTYDIFENGNSWAMIMRIDSDGSIWSVTENDNGHRHLEYEFEAGKIVLETELAQWLEDDCSRVTQADFIAMVERAVAVLSTFPIRPDVQPKTE